MPECCIYECERDATRKTKPTPMGKRREFCEACFAAWRRGAKTRFVNGIPRGERIQS